LQKSPAKIRLFSSRAGQVIYHRPYLSANEIRQVVDSFLKEPYKNKSLFQKSLTTIWLQHETNQAFAIDRFL